MAVSKPRIYFQNINRFLRRDITLAMPAAGFEPGFYINDPFVPADPDDIQAKVHVLHPERMLPLLFEDKKHSFFQREMFPEH